MNGPEVFGGIGICHSCSAHDVALGRYPASFRRWRVLP